MTKNNPFCEITPELEHLSELSAKCSVIDPELYSKYDVKRGLRDINGKGVLVGLTEISDVCSTKMVDGVSQPADGEVYYRGYNVKDIIAGIDENSHFGFEECTYLLLFPSCQTPAFHFYTVFSNKRHIIYIFYCNLISPESIGIIKKFSCLYVNFF